MVQNSHDSTKRKINFDGKLKFELLSRIMAIIKKQIAAKNTVYTHKI